MKNMRGVDDEEKLTIHYNYYNFIKQEIINFPFSIKFNVLQKKILKLRISIIILSIFIKFTQHICNS